MDTTEGQEAPGKVTAREVEDVVAGASATVTPIQRAGIQILYAVGAAIIILTILIGWITLSNLPSPPPNPSATDDLARYKELIGLYEQSRKTALERTTQMFQLVVATTLMPVFTTVLGYIFGSRRASD